MAVAAHPGVSSPTAADWGFGALFDAIKDAVVVSDAATGRILLWNHGAEEVFQYSIAEAQGMLLEDLIPASHREAHRKGIAEYAAHRGGVLLDSDAAVEVPALRRDGREILIQLKLSRIQNPRDPTGAYAMGLIRDVTRLRESEQAVKLILDTSSQPMFALDVSGACTLANPAAAKLLGYERDELVGENMHTLMHHSRPDGSPYPETECLIHQAFRAGLPSHVDTELFWHRDGTAFPADYRSHPILRNDTLLGAVVTFTDLTEVRRGEAQARDREALLRESALTDVLTGVGNRRYADEVMKDLETGDAVALIDIDHFKRVNDTYGHSQGDKTLVALAGHLQGQLRVGDNLARFGGEEFLLVLRGAGLAARTIVGRMAEEWARLDPETTFSAGVAVHGAGRTPKETLQRADTAMYEAKRQGRDRVVQHGPLEQE